MQKNSNFLAKCVNLEILAIFSEDSWLLETTSHNYKSTTHTGLEDESSNRSYKTILVTWSQIYKFYLWCWHNKNITCKYIYVFSLDRRWLITLKNSVLQYLHGITIFLEFFGFELVFLEAKPFLNFSESLRVWESK